MGHELLSADYMQSTTTTHTEITCESVMQQQGTRLHRTRHELRLVADRQIVQHADDKTCGTSLEWMKFARTLRDKGHAIPTTTKTKE